MATHELKVWPEYFDAILRGFKTFELRFNDRGFECGDTLLLREWDHVTEQYTGQECSRLITNMLNQSVFGLEEGYCILSIVDESIIKRLEALERLYEATVRRNEALERQMALAFRPDSPDADRKFITAEKEFYQADDDIDEILEQLGEMGGVSHQQGS